MKGPTGRECSQFTDVSVIALSGRQTSTLKFDNPDRRRVEKIEIDGCVIIDGRRCDWLLRTNDHDFRQDIFVELKGSHVEEAIQQLEATLPQLARKEQSVLLRCYVVHTRFRMPQPDIAKHKLRFKNRFQARLETARDGNTVTL